VDAQRVDEVFEQITKEFLGQARVPGFRPGKVPRETILKLYGKQIESQAKEEIVKKVMKERYVKENTIMVNLQNPKLFKKLKDGRYEVAGK